MVRGRRHRTDDLSPSSADAAEVSYLWHDRLMPDEQTTPVPTRAADAIAAAGIAHRVVRTERASSAEESARFQGIETRQLLRTIVVRRGEGDYLFVLVPAGRRFDWPKLRELLGVRRMTLPDADEARAATGYERYTITPFGSTTGLAGGRRRGDRRRAGRLDRRRRLRDQPPSRAGRPDRGPRGRRVADVSQPEAEVA